MGLLDLLMFQGTFDFANLEESYDAQDTADRKDKAYA
jgi:hypothetical protein